MGSFQRAAYLQGPGGTLRLRKGFSLTRSANAGWSGSVTTSDPVAINAPAGSIFRIVLVQRDSEGEIRQLESAPLEAAERTRRAEAGRAETRTLQLVDHALARMARPGQSWPTFRNTTSGGIAQTIAGWAGVKVEGLEDWFVPLEEVKQSKPLDALRRLAAAAGQDFQVTEEGHLVFYRATANLGAVARRSVKRAEWGWSLAGQCTGLRIERQSPLVGEIIREFSSSAVYSFALPVPMSQVVYQDLSESGYIDQVCLWNGDPKADGKLISVFSRLQFQGLNVPMNGSPPITHVSLSVYKSVIGVVTGEEVRAVIRIIGTPWESVLENRVTPGFSAFLGTQEWPAEQPWNEPLVPSLAFAVAHQVDWLWQRSKGGQPCSGEFSRWVLDATPGQTVSPLINGETWALTRIDSVTHSDSATSYTGHVVTYS